MAEYVARPNKFLLRGMNVVNPSNMLGMEWAQLIRNLRSYRVGEIRQRPGLALVADVDAGAVSPLLFEQRINDFTTSTFRRFVGTAEGKVYVDNAGHTAFSLADSGFSSAPMSGLIAATQRSPLPYSFIANDARQSKFNTTGSRTEWGLTAPLVPPVAELSTPAYNTVNTCNSSGGFASSGGAVTNPNRFAAVAMAARLYDTGTSGWLNIVPASMDENFQEGSFITFSGGPETTIIETVYPAIASTTVQGIAYDSGSTGLCTIQLSTPTVGLQRNSILYLNSTEYVRVISVTMGLDGIPSLRCSTVGTIAIGNTVVGQRSFRCFVTGNHTTAETLSLGYVQIAVAASGLSTLSKVEAHDLTSTLSGVAGRPLTNDDYIHISLRVSDFSLVTEIQLQFDVDSTTNDFTQNYFFKSIRQPDLQAAYEQSASSITAQQQQIQRQQIDDFTRQELLAERDRLLNAANINGLLAGAGVLIRDRINQINQQLTSSSGEGALSNEGVGGANQWTELKIPFREFQRVGSDTSRGWKDTQAFQISINTTGAVDVGLSSLWAGGSYGPDYSLGQTTTAVGNTPVDGYEYCYVARNTTTGSVSNPSPPTRYQVLPQREAVSVSVPTAYSDSQADVYDYYRRGGTLGDWQFLATVPVGSSTYLDDLPDEVVATQSPLSVKQFKPWPTLGEPVSGTVTVVGTTVLSTAGDPFDPAWVRGNTILINNQAYSFYSNPTSTTRLELNESAGYGTGLAWEMPSPLSDGQPLPFVFGPYSGAGGGDYCFGLGDPINPGTLYFTNSNDPESASDRNALVLSPPTEPLIAGGILDGIIYVWSDRRSWRILPSFNGGQSGLGADFYAQETAMGKGLPSRWGLTFGDQIYFVSWDGIYATKGDAITSLTDESLSPLFRKDGSESTFNSFNGVFPISFTSSDVQFLSLTYSRDGLYFTEQDIEGNRLSWYYSFLTRGWFIDSFTPESSRMFREAGGIDADVLLMGSADGRLYTVDVAERDDNGTPIACRLLTREEDWGDTRAQKQIGDIMIDADPGAVNTLNLTLRLDYNDTLIVLDPITVSGRDIFIRNINNGAGVLARTAALDIEWDTQPTGSSFVYEWSPTALIKPAASVSRYTDWSNGGYDGPKFLQGFRLHCDTYGNDFDIRVQGDEGAILETLRINHNGESIKEYILDPPAIGHLFRITPNEDDLLWRFFNVEWVYEPEPPLVTYWETQSTSLDLPDYSHFRSFMIAHRSTTDVILQVTLDNSTTQIYTIPNSGGQRARTYIVAEALKAKLRRLRFTSTDPFSLYLKDSFFLAKPWGSDGAYLPMQLAGDVTRTNGGARI